MCDICAENGVKPSKDHLSEMKQIKHTYPDDVNEEEKIGNT